MRSFLTTLVLAALALALGYLAMVQIKDQDLSSIFGAPPRKIDETLFTFDPTTATRLELTNSSGLAATFEKKAGLWFLRSPSEDRADFRHLQSLVFATRHLVIEEITTADELGDPKARLKEGAYEIKITDNGGHEIAHYKLGQRTPWHRLIGEKGETTETFFIKPMGRFDDDHIYVCAGADARVLLDAGLDVLRDHRPFLFNAQQLADIQIKGPHGDILLARPDLLSPWRITKPLSLRTDPDAVARLVLGLYEMEAPKLHDPASVTIPPRSAQGPHIAITLGRFDSKGLVRPDRITLEVESPATPDATFAYAKVTGRSAIFELPLTPAKGRISLSDLPVAVNDLRSRTLLSRPPSSLHAVTISSPDSKTPLLLTLGKDPVNGGPRWIITRAGIPEQANEDTVNRLFTALALHKVLGFSSDAPADLTPFGLNPPAKTILLEYGKDQKIEIDFGIAPDGKYYAHRRDESSVMEIDPGTFDYIETEPSAWRDSLLWTMSVSNLEGFTIEHPNQPPLHLSYNFLTEEWAAEREGRDITVLLNKQRANILLEKLESLRVLRWLGPNHEQAANRLFDPSLTFEVVYEVQDDFGEKIGSHRRLLNLVPASYAAGNQLFYGRLSGDPDFFLLDKTTYDHLNVPLLEE